MTKAVWGGVQEEEEKLSGKVTEGAGWTMKNPRDDIAEFTGDSL